MPTLVVQITIGDYAKWRPLFDENKPLRDRAGLRNVRVYRDADHPRELIVVSETSDPSKARDALSSPDFRNAMQEAGVMAPPKVHVLAPGCAELAPALLGAVTAEGAVGAQTAKRAVRQSPPPR
jgi:quinol monooxygenase YgiN